jgi:chromate reductase
MTGRCCDMGSVLHVLGVSGSLRRGSHNTALLRAAADVAPDSVKVDLHPPLALPLYDADLEAAGMPLEVLSFRKAIRAADALLIATPEYNWSTSGVLKNALDWASRGGADSPLNHKPSAIVGAGGRYGTLRAQLHLREILNHNQVQLLARPELTVPAAGRFEGGRLVDEEIAARLRVLLEALEDLARSRKVAVADAPRERETA